MRRCVHLCGIDPSLQPHRYALAVRVFGIPDFVHPALDLRALGDVAEGDVVIEAQVRKVDRRAGRS